MQLRHKPVHGGSAAAVQANAYKSRQTHWTDSIAIGSVDFVKTIKSELGALAQGRKILEHGDSYQLREELGTYIAHFEGKNGNIEGKNGNIGDVSV